MAKFLTWTDLHNEFWNDIPEIPKQALDVDALLLAGDTWTLGRHVDAAITLWNRLRKPVIMVRGNHEFYGGSISEIIENETAKIAEFNSLGGDIRMLDGHSTIVNGTRVVGATLWTDLDLYPGHHTTSVNAVRGIMNDFSKICTRPGKQFRVEDWLEMHWRDREAIFAELKTPYPGPTLVMTHHIPVRSMIHPLREIGETSRWLTNAGFASDMEWQLKEHAIDAWVCGHSHDNRCATVEGLNGPFNIHSNARGYPKEGAEFKPDFIVETPDFSPEKTPLDDITAAIYDEKRHSALGDCFSQRKG